MSHGAAGVFHGLFYGAATVLFFVILWRWRQWYVTAPDAAQARRTLWRIAGVALLFTALWLTCGRVSMQVAVLQWAIPPVACAGVVVLAIGLRPPP